MTNYNIQKNRKPLSQEEIAKHMDFKKFHAGYSAHAGWLGKTAKLYLGISASVVAVVAIAYTLHRSAKTTTRSEIVETFISPPVPELNPKAGHVVINNDRDTTLTYPSGATIHLPAHLFKAADGSPVEGPVEIVYREFHDQADILLSGIPMHYDSLGGKYDQLESAGMFEILALKNGKPVYLRQDKTLTVSMPSADVSNDYNVYYLDTVQKAWILNPVNTEENKKQINALDKQKEAFIRRYDLVDPQKMITPGRIDPNHPNFTIEYDAEEFPELSVYQGVKFELDEPDRSYNTRQAQITWEDVLVRHSADPKHYTITFKKGKEIVSYKVRPVFDDKDFDKAMKEYEALRAYHQKRLQTISDSLVKQEADLLYKAEHENGYNSRFANFVTNKSVYRNIVVNRLGTWNHDRPIRFLAEKEEDLFVAHFKAAGTGEELPVKSVYLINRAINTVYAVPAKKINRLAFSKDVDIMVLLSPDHHLYFLRDAELKNLNYTVKDVSFVMHPMDAEHLDYNVVKSLLNI